MNEQIKLTDLTAEQLLTLTKQLKATAQAQRKAGAGTRTAWKSLVDNMMREKDATGFKHTTADVLAALQAKSLVAKEFNRAEELKKIQTRKQKLAKLRDKAGKLVHAEGTLGFKASLTGVGALTVERCIAFLNANGYPNLKAK